MRMKPLNLLPKPEKDKAAVIKPIVRQKKTTNNTAPQTSGRKLLVTMEDGMIVIRMPFTTAPVASSTGKSMLYGSTRGPKRVMQEVDGKFEYVTINGGYLKAIASAFVAVEASKEQKAETQNQGG